MSVLSTRVPFAAPADVLVRLPVFARGPVLGLAAVVAVVLLVTSAGYGYLPDELYFLSAGKHLAWGYADQPPLVPLLAHVLDSLFPGSPVALRLPVTLLTGGSVVVTALLAREFGGRRRAQVLAAAANAICPVIISQGHHLLTTTVDWALGNLLVWLLVRWVRTRDDRLWLAIGLVSALELQTKYFLVFFWAAAILAILCTGPRDVFRRPLFWSAGGASVLLSVPSLVWQAVHGWPQVAMDSVITTNVAANGGRWAFVPLVIGYAGLAGGVLFAVGLWQLLRADWLRPYRFLGLTILMLGAIFLVTEGRPYYVAGMFGVCWAAGAVRLQRRQPARWWAWTTAWPTFAVSALIIIRGIAPLPADQPGPDSYLVTLVSDDWPGLADQVATVYDQLPPADRANTVLFANSYAQAGSLDRFGPELGLPPVYSASYGYWYFGAPADSVHTIVNIGDLPDPVRRQCGQLRELGDYHPRGGNGNAVPITLCSDLRTSWSQLWPELREV